MYDGGVPPESWESLDGVDLADTFLQRVPMLQSCPHFLRGRLRFCFSMVLRERTRARQAGDERAEIRAWKLFGLILMMLLLLKPQGSGSVGLDQLAHRADEFARGRWDRLLRAARQNLFNRSQES